MLAEKGFECWDVAVGGLVGERVGVDSVAAIVLDNKGVSKCWVWLLGEF